MLIDGKIARRQETARAKKWGWEMARAGEEERNKIVIYVLSREIRKVFFFFASDVYWQMFFLRGLVRDACLLLMVTE